MKHGAGLATRHRFVLCRGAHKRRFHVPQPVFAYEASPEASPEAEDEPPSSTTVTVQSLFMAML